MDRYDVIAIGGGIGGSGCATVLARAGLSVLVLEPTTEYPDIVRGEWIGPWGIVEARTTGLHDVFVEAGAHLLTQLFTFDEAIEGETALRQPLPMGVFVPDIEGPLCIRHPIACQALADAAVVAGATVLRGVSHIASSDGVVSYTANGTSAQARGRLVIGADGRGSPVRRALGIELEKSETDHYLGGVLVDGLEWWDDTSQCVATEDRDHVLLFPQGGGRARIYIAFETADRERFAGPDRARAFLEACVMDCWPGSQGFEHARAVSPAHAYRSADTWTTRPFAPGVVLVGDAAGYNDPIIGQGLSITNRDIRLVTEAILSSDDWPPELFEDYGAERAERMRRLRLSAQTYTIVVAAQEAGRDPDVRKAFAEDMNSTLMLVVPMAGPYGVPAESFDAIEARLAAL
jgi:menaquinone-9 beta-reductase